jgi:hypothetical protein
MGANAIESVAALSGILNGRNMDSRGGSSASGQVQQQQQQSNQQQQSSASGQRNRIVEIVETPGDRHDDAPEDYYISDLYTQLTQVIAAKPCELETLRIGKKAYKNLLKKNYS